MMSETTYFKSRRNKVWREGEIVYKQFCHHDGERMEAVLARAAYEAETLEHLRRHGVFVPQLISCKKDIIAMEYIKSINLVDFIELAENVNMHTEVGAVVGGIVGWFNGFYSAKSGQNRGDVNGRNILITPAGRVAGVDFEEPCYGKKEVDVGKLIAFVLTYEPKYTEFKTTFANMLVDEFIDRFDVDKNAIEYEKNIELAQMQARRQRK